VTLFVKDRLVLALSGLVFTVLGCSVVLGQQTNPAPVQPDGASSNRQSSQFPDAPAPGTVPSAARNGGVSQPESSSSSSSQAIQPRFWTSTDPNAQVTVPEDTLIRVMTNVPLSTREAREGELLVFTLAEDVVVDNVLIIPRGATVHGTVVQSKKAGKLTGSPDLILQLVSLDLGGRSYPVYSYEFKAEGASKTKPTETKIKGGAVIGAIVGVAFDGSAKGTTTAAGKLAGMGTGAGLGAGIGTAVSVATPGPVLFIPAESQIDFYLAYPISVVPTSAKEAARLSQGLHAGGPVLYVRGETP
jgi:hypothetical protein